MYKHLKSLAVFVTVAQTGAFNKAAKKLDLQPSVVSHHINKLEAHLGTRLIYRSTRQLNLSEQGEALYHSTQTLFQSTENVIAQLSANSNEPRGLLRVSLPQFVPDPKIEQAIWSFHQKYPHIELSLDFTDEQVKLPSNHIDLAIRIGKQSDSNLMTKQLSAVEHILVASPAFLASKAEDLSSPDQLLKWPCINLGCSGKALILTKQPAQIEVAAVPSGLTVNSINAALNAAIAGIGFTDLPPALCEHALETGKLVRLLPDWQLPTLPICATYSGKVLHNSLIKLLLVHIEQTLESQA